MTAAVTKIDLTARESECVALLTQGLTNQQIADILGISPSTVRAHLRSASHRLRVRRRTALAAWWVRTHGIRERPQ
ncbi:MAG: helix-turn-helix transcriptional regulator [Chloroflexi bacterium]|nr:helix-turn-helix transcriptional regulator [Chloroflexota bacterium]